MGHSLSHADAEGSLLASKTAERADRPCARLELRGISKTFGGIRALDDVSFAVGAGEIHALVGENGAGKSTLVKIVTGLHSVDSGAYFLDGVPREFQSVLDARAAGVVAVHQDPRLFPHLDVAENIFMGIQPMSRFGSIDRRAMYARAQEMLDRLDAQLDATAIVAGLSIGETQFIEFARALIEGADKLLILDEPTAALSPSETERLFRILRQLKAKGTSVVFISHRLEELAGLVETVTVLRDGKHVATRPAADLDQAEVVRLMVGRSIDALYVADESKPKDPADGPDGPDGAVDVLRVEALAQRGAFEDISFSVAQGEIVGMAGLVGAGRTEIAQTLFGIAPPTSGRVFIRGEEVSIHGPRQMLRHGLAYLPEDRESEGLIAHMSLTKNIVLPVLRQLATAGMLRPAKERELASRQAHDLQIKAGSLEDAVSTLSGGNRQKVVLGKWLATGPAVLILDEPTHGIDVGAKAQVHQIIRRLASTGVGILMISSDLPEILHMSDRVLVVSDGRLAGEFTRAEATQESIMTAATASGRHPSGVSPDAHSAGSTPDAPAPARTDWTLRALQNRALGVLVFLTLLAIFFSLLTTNFATIANANTIVLNGSILVIVACAEAIVIMTRNYDLSVGSIVALASFVGFDVIRSFPELGPVLILVPIAVGGACGVINGWLVAYGRVPSVIATLGTLSIFRGLAFLYAGGGQVNPSEIPDWVGASVSGQILGLSPLVVVAVIVVAAVAFLLRQARLGREIYAIGSNPDAAAYYGLRAPRIVFCAYVLCGLLTGVAAFLFGARVSYIVPYLAQGLELEVLAAVVIGGVSVLGGSGTVVGAAIGAVTIATIDNGLVLLGASEFTRRFIQGAAIVAAVSVDAAIHQRARTLLKARRRRGAPA